MEQSLVETEARDKESVAQGSGSQAAQMDGSAGNLLATAGKGFTLDPQVAANLAAACQTAMDHISDMQIDLRVISEAPKLGTLTGAQTVATYTQNVATDPQGMLQAMQSLNATLQQMHDAYIRASTNYQETNEQVADILKNIDPDYSPPATPPPAGSATHFNA
jgi:hypothetical protein